MGFKDAGKPHYLGHREQLTRRFREAGPDALPDYELLELILFRAAPRRDTKPLAKALIARFGTFAEALNAPEELLREIPGVGAAVTELKLVRAAALRLMSGEVLERQVLSSWAQVLDYCRASMGFANKEQFRILFLDKRNQIIADHIACANCLLGIGGIDRADLVEAPRPWRAPRAFQALLALLELGEHELGVSRSNTV